MIERDHRKCQDMENRHCTKTLLMDRIMFEGRNALQNSCMVVPETRPIAAGPRVFA